MAVPKVDTFKDYTRYAEHCLNMVASITDQELRCIQMAKIVSAPNEWEARATPVVGVPVSGL
jgi:hypothetical protein